MHDQMRTSKNGLDFIARWEGCVLKPYKDIAGLRTIGIGHLIKPHENFPDGVEITMEKALELLAADVKSCEDSIKLRIKVPLNQNQFDALVSFGFNCGTGVYVLSDACKALNLGNYNEVPEKLLSWSKARINGVMQVNKGLYNRRVSEGQLFMKLPTKAIPTSSADSKLTPLTIDLLKEVQNHLKRLGLYMLKIDGLWGKGTRSGLQSFASQNSLDQPDASGKHISLAVLEALRKKSNCEP